MEKYVYPDDSDNLTCLYISTDSNEKYWADSEQNVLNKIVNKIKHLPTPPNFLDLGCGLGRLFSVFYPYVSSITGLEPDYNRFSEALKEAQRIDDSKIIVINDFIDSVKTYKFNSVLVSHVFQHIPFEITKNTLNTLKNIIPSGGLLFITTTFTDASSDIFTLEYLKNGKHFSEPVSEKDFIKRFNEKGLLPVREFCYNTMNSLFTEKGFIIEEMFTYHFDISLTDKLPTVDFDEQRNKAKLYKGSKDVLYILRRL